MLSHVYALIVRRRRIDRRVLIGFQNPYVKRKTGCIPHLPEMPAIGQVARLRLNNEAWKTSRSNVTPRQSGLAMSRDACPKGNRRSVLTLVPLAT